MIAERRRTIRTIRFCIGQFCARIEGPRKAAVVHSVAETDRSAQSERTSSKRRLERHRFAVAGEIGEQNGVKLRDRIARTIDRYRLILHVGDDDDDEPLLRASLA
jgi:hypothetical protein